jgi:tetratricopeptide (TPR) repeat protein
MVGRAPRQSRKQAADALDRAQDLIYDAWEAGSAKQRLALARKALEISPRCADAYVLLAGQARRGSDAELELWRQGVAAGEAALGKAGFAEFAGHFWGFLETRPYMRARLGLAMALWRRGAREEAVEHLRDMLRLNPGDNQGVRYILAAFLVELDRDTELAALLEQYAEDGAAAWAYTAALLAFRREQDTAASRKLLAEAIESNEFVPGYLLGERKMPARPPGFMGVGDAAEAVHFVNDFGAGWKATPGALDWLRRKVSGTKGIDSARAGRDT